MTLPDVLKAAGIVTLAGTQFQVFWTTPDPNPFEIANAKSPALQTALNSAIDAVLQNGQTRVEPRLDPSDANFAKAFPIPFTIADLTETDRSLRKVSDGMPVAHYNGDEMDFVASEAKVAVMYAAFQLRQMVRQYAIQLGIKKKADLFSKLKDLNPIILNNPKVPMLKAKNDIEGKPVRISNDMRLPQYERVFDVTETAAGLVIDFKGKLESAARVPVPRRPGRTMPDPNSDFGHALFEMIATSDDPLAGTCIHGIGYGFLNGALIAGGYFDHPAENDPKTYRGLWVSGDYAGQEDRGVWVVNDNPRGAKIAGTTRRFAQLFAAILLKQLAAIDPADQMTLLLKAAVAESNVWEDEVGLAGNRINKTYYTYNKIGFAELGRRFGKSPLTYSEVSVLQSVSGKKYAVAWQNLQTKPPVMVHGEPQWNEWSLYSPYDIAGIIRGTVKQYESIPGDPFP